MSSRAVLVSGLAWALGIAIVAMPAGARSQTITTSPSTDVDPYMTTHLSGMTIESILTVDDGTVPKTGGGSTRLAGIPDGLGAIDGDDLSPPEPGYFYLLVNHELPAAQGIARAHGGTGAFISKWKVDKVTHEVVEGEDLIKEFFDWDASTDTFVAGSTNFDRLCSANLPARTAIYNSNTGLGSQEILYLNGEETTGGRLMGHVVTGPDAGKTYHLEHFGFAANENVLLCPFEQDTTVGMVQDDAENGEVYCYVGTKQSTGTEVEKAGLVGGNLYALAIATPTKKAFELQNVIANGVLATETFTLKLIGTPGNRPANGTEVEARGTDTVTPVDPTQTFQSLKMGGPEDGSWDTRAGFENTYYFVTKGTTSNGLNAVTRLWRLEFDDIGDPAAGGTMSLLLDGPALRLGSLDNMTFEVIDGDPKLFIQEDLGDEARLSKIWEYDVTSGQIEEIAQPSTRFFAGGPSFLTENEESSGIIPLTDILGEGWFAMSMQVHTATGLSAPSEQVEHGQLILMNIDGRGADFQRERIVASGDNWNFRVDGVDPGATWKDVGFVVDASWNKTTSGTLLGPSPTPIGYGESAGVLRTNVVSPPSPRAAAYYFRTEFDLADPDAVSFFDIFMKLDDGGVVYVNGVDVARYNIGLETMVGNTTLAVENEAAEGDWKHLRVACGDLSLQATGNVVAVSVHQENPTSSDIRVDMELFAWNVSPDAGSAPATPSGLDIIDVTEISLELTWAAQADAKFFRIQRQRTGDVAWEVIQEEYPGSFTSYVDTDVTGGVTYHYQMTAVNVHGMSACSSEVSELVPENLLPVIFSEDFEVPSSFGKFTAVDVLEPDRGFAWVLWDFGSTGAVQGNNFGAGLDATEDWLITTDPINFEFFTEEQMFYDAQISFGGPTPEVLYSTDYDPAVHSNPNDATWTVINTDTSATATLTAQGPFPLTGIARAHIAFKYTGNGGAGGQSKRATFDDVIVQGNCGYDFEGAENGNIADNPGPWIVVNVSSAFGWIYDLRFGRQGAINNNFASGAGGTAGGTAADDYLISPLFAANNPNTVIEFDYEEEFGDTISDPLTVLVTDDYTGDPTTTTWTDITPTGLNGSNVGAWGRVTSQTIGITGRDLRFAFHYKSGGNGSGTTKRLGIDNVCISEVEGPLEADFAFTRDGASVSFVPQVDGGVPPYTFAWDFGDETTSTDAGPTHLYTEEGLYTVSVVVTDDAGDFVTVTKVDLISVTRFVVPEAMGSLRVATYNASMNRAVSGGLATDLATGTNAQIRKVAEVIQRANPDVIVINEYDQIFSAGVFDHAATEDTIEDFKANYLEVAQASDTQPIFFDYHFVAACNTGIPSGLDLNNNGTTTQPEDAYGFGEFPGQFAFVFLSKYPIDEDAVRTFQMFLWRDMPGANLPPDPLDSDGDGDLDSYYNEAELDVFRLSSKSHWDIPVLVDDQRFHVLASHPTPPVFDDGQIPIHPNVADWNGLRNHDEIRFWADYVDTSVSSYIYDDAEWASAGGQTPREPSGGLAGGERFVIAGDQNADPTDGDATFNPILLLLENALVDTSITPSSPGALEQVPVGSFRDTKTASFLLRADYVLPSILGWDLLQAFILWPLLSDIEANLLSASDHRLVAIDVELTGTPFSRGDCDNNGSLSLGDALKSLRYQFLNDATPDCLNACDFNNDGRIRIGDPISELNFLFLGAAPPPAPYPGCGLDPDETGLDCEAPASCQ